MTHGVPNDTYSKQVEKRSLRVQSLVRRSGFGLRKLFMRFRKPPPPGLSLDSSYARSWVALRSKPVFCLGLLEDRRRPPSRRDSTLAPFLSHSSSSSWKYGLRSFPREDAEWLDSIAG